MKPAPFAYHRPTTVDEVLTLLAEHGHDAKILAGGQSLVPTMNFRLAQPAALIDVNSVEELSYISGEDADGVRIGAMTRQRAVEQDSLVTKEAPLVHEAMPFVAHPQIRNRGTVGGSIAHADPAAELPAVALALGGRFRIRNRNGERWIAARDFFTGLFTTSLSADDLLVEVVFPALPPRSGYAFDEVARRHGDFALVGAAAVIVIDDDGRCNHARLAFLSVGDGPVLAAQASQLLVGEVLAEDAITAAAEAAATRDIDPPRDIHASSAYRRQLARVLTRRVLTRAAGRAKESTA